MQTKTKIEDKVLVDIEIAQSLQINDSTSTNEQSLIPDKNQVAFWLFTAIEVLQGHNSAVNTKVSNAILDNPKPVGPDRLPLEISIKIVSVGESTTLNLQYRNKNKPTNVLSFESDLPDFVPSNFIGDLAICADIVKLEAIEQGKIISHHWAHLCVHGLLHLLGYDHIDDIQAEQMEGLEVEILNKLGIDDPYQIS